jgi:hypothetical protein
MKSWLFAACAAGAAACAPMAFAQSWDLHPSWYGTLGYSDTSTDNGADLSGITGRIGARLNPYFGAEGEVTAGIGADRFDAAHGGLGAHLNDQYAGYAVGYLPVQPNLDLLARAGFGHSDFHVNGPGFGADTGADSWNFGAGAQYFLTPKNGLRAEYTREDYQCSHCSGADVWSVAFVRKF